MDGLAQRICQAPLAHDAARAADVLGKLDDGLRRGTAGDLLAGAAGSSPYLARLMLRHSDWLAQTIDVAPEASLQTLLNDLSAEAAECAAQSRLASALRLTKSRAALLIALADLGGAWDLSAVTSALTKLAETACSEAARWLLRQEIKAGKLPGLEMDALDRGAGYILIAMGKMGAGELNYSSDIDLIALFEDGMFDPDDVLDARARYIHVTKQMVSLLSENTADGYVFRTDLRLRPAPSTTPVCMSRDAAERYYESVGRTWERAAHIKARALIDEQAGDAYLQTLVPFIWRRHLDFAAIDDIHDMLRKIRAQRAKFSATSVPGVNIKLDAGGIREIEFFAQTRQLIMGGRNPALRVPTTLGALGALQQADLVDESTVQGLTDDYVALRTLEHRLQMIEDSQTHSIPAAEDARDRLAALSGYGDRAAFEAEIAERMERVHDLTADFFGTATPSQEPAVEISEDSSVLAGFERPADAARQLARWRDGEIAATRSERAQALFVQLEPQIVNRLAGATSPDQALAQFDRFLSSLPAGVQVFSLFTANPQLLDLIISICAAAPRLAVYLGRRAQVLDALLDRDFWEPMGDIDQLCDDLNARIGDETDYERILDATRRWARDHWFRAGVHVLRGVVSTQQVGHEFTRIAETCIACLLPHVIAQFATRHGPPPGQGMAVLAMGKLGSHEMTAGSDLDIITIYDAQGVEASDGPRPLPPGTYYPRLTQALVSALTAQTAEGTLYQVDMRLRPSGSQGPVAVSRTAFESYHRDGAWVWEHLALTRARCVSGPTDLTAAIGDVIDQAMDRRKGTADVLPQAREMRAKLIDANASQRQNPWSLKHAAGALMEIEFLTQTGVLLHGLKNCRSTPQALPLLQQQGWLSADDVAVLIDTFELHQSLQQIERVALDGELDRKAIGDALQRVLVQTANVPDLERLEIRLTESQAAAAQIIDRIFAGVQDA